LESGGKELSKDSFVQYLIEEKKTASNHSS